MSGTHSPKGSGARRLVLDLVLSKREFPTRAFPDEAERAGLEERERALARALLAGVIRRRRTLDALWRPFSSRRTLDPPVAWTLRVALYQRFFLDGIPPYAAFNETLDAGKSLLRRSTGYANAVLRAVHRSAQELEAAPEEPGPEVFVEGGRAWRFDRPIFADRTAEPERHWGERLSYPDFLVRRWFRHVGEISSLSRMRHFNATPPLALRVNPLRSDREAVQKLLQEGGFDARTGEPPHSLVLHQPTGEVARLPGFKEGLWSVQDLSAQAAVAVAAPQPGERILDLCAAPGGKSFASYEQSGGQVFVTACDVNPRRLKKLRSDQERLGHDLRTLQIEEGESPRHEDGDWDLVILDVPCTNTGVLGRRPEARWNSNDRELRRSLSAQKRIVQNAVHGLLGAGTRVLWTTCSLEPEENENAAAKLAVRLGLVLAEAVRFEPDRDRSGGFAALLVPDA